MLKRNDKIIEKIAKKNLINLKMNIKRIGGSLCRTTNDKVVELPTQTLSDVLETTYLTSWLLNLYSSASFNETRLFLQIMCIENFAIIIKKKIKNNDSVSKKWRVTILRVQHGKHQQNKTIYPKQKTQNGDKTTSFMNYLNNFAYQTLIKQLIVTLNHLNWAT